MNKKFAFIVVQNEPRKMERIIEYKISGVLIVVANF
jgi:hypothetical protein